ncbi:SpoIIE family protein phosphatase [Streptomyces bauhiniae]|uniref:SpoIIE family protein phosphatase n=1 Tax=Streptomyces bauhiniae TaxID=2340725 RepID=UPI00365C6905
MNDSCAKGKNARLVLLEGVRRDLDEPEVWELAVQHAVAELGAMGGAVHLRGSRATLHLVTVVGMDPADAKPWTILDAEGCEAPAQAVRQGCSVWEPRQRFGHSSRSRGFGDPRLGYGLAVVPVLIEDRPVGALTVVMTDSGPTPEHWDFLHKVTGWAQERIAVATLTGRSEENVRAGWPGWNSRAALAALLDSSIRTGERASRTTALTSALAEASTCQDVVDALAQNVLPAAADSSLFLVVNAVENGRVRTFGSRGVGGELLEKVDGRPLLDRDPIREAIVSGEPVFVRSLEEYERRYPDLISLARVSGANAAIYLPLAAAGHTFGVCVIGYERYDTAPSSEETTLLKAVSALVAHALERARLYEAESTRSHVLQRSLLPRDLPRLPECTTAARYLPAGRGMEVGGDWYDVIPLSAGRVAFVIGDVMGHGLAEAATMGRLRTAVRTLADLELPPDEIMSRLNCALGELGQDSYVTCLYALYDSTDGHCSIVSAGHPPPAVVRPDGTVYFVDLVVDPPLGTADPPFQTTELTLSPESLLVFYTDGLVESAVRPIDRGLAALSELLHTANRTDLDRLSARLVAELLPPDHSSADDSALLVARVHALAADHMASWPLPEDPQAAQLARGLVREQLRAWRLEELTTTTELLVSELVANVIRYAKGPMRLRLLRGEDLICEVSDGSLTMPRMRQATDTDEGGRGLQLVSILSQRWGTRYTETGKSIWTAQSLPTSAPAQRLRSDTDSVPG